MDIDECVRATAGCSPNAGCINSKGGFTCTCYYGFSGKYFPTGRWMTLARSTPSPASEKLQTSSARMHTATHGMASTNNVIERSDVRLARICAQSSTLKPSFCSLGKLSNQVPPAGNGTTCDPTAALSALAGMYVTDGASKIACTEGSNIAQPPGSPGWVDDPTGSVQGSAAHAVSHLMN